MAPSRPVASALATALLAACALVVGARPARADFESAKKYFLDNVKSPEWKARRSAYGAFQDHDGGPAATLLLQQVGAETHPAVIEAAATTLAGMRSSEARAAAIASAKKPKSSERVVAQTALLSMRGNDVDAALVEAVASPNAPVATMAALALGQGTRSGASEALVKALAHPAWQVRGAAARSLGARGDRAALAPLVARLEVEKGRARAEVVGALEAVSRQRLGDSPKRWAALAAGGDPSTVEEAAALAPTFFGVPVTGERVVFVLDRSLHMRDAHPWVAPEQRERLEELCSPKDGERIPWRQVKTKWQLAVAHLRHAVEGLPSGARFEVFYFAADVKSVFAGKGAPAGAAARKTLDEVLATIETDDGINLWDALLGALDMAGAAEDKAFKAGPDQVLLVTNNIPTRGDVADADVVARAIGLRARARFVPVSVVGIGNHPFALAETLTKTSGGVYVNLSK